MSDEKPLSWQDPRWSSGARAAGPGAARPAAWQPCPHTSTICCLGHFLQLFPGRGLLAQNYHLLGQEGKAPTGLGLWRVNGLLL